MALPAASRPQLYEEGLKLMSFCPLCENSFAPRETRVLHEREHGQLLHIRCGWCENSLLATIDVSLAGISSLGLFTDLTAQEAMHFRESEPISTDDVIETHCLLEQPELLFARLTA